MFLRAENDDKKARVRIAALDGNVRALQQKLGPHPTPEDARTRLDLARILCWCGRYRPTLELIEPLTSGEFEREIVFEARQMIGDNHFRHDQYDLASKQYHGNLKLAKAAGDEFWFARAEEGIALVFIEVGHYTTGEFIHAARIFERLVQLYGSAGRGVHEGMAMYGLSRAAAGNGDYGRALEFARQSIDVLNKSGADHLVQVPLLQLANVHRDRGHFSEALPFYAAAIDAADRSQDTYTQTLIALGYGIMLRSVGDTDSVVELWRSVLPMIDDLEYPRAGHEICGRLATAAAEREDFEDAYRMQCACQEYGNRIGVLSSVLQNQQMLLRDQIHRTAQLEDTLSYLQAGVKASVDGIFVLEKQESGIDKDEFLAYFVNDSACRMLAKKQVAHMPLRSIWTTGSADLLIGPSHEVFASGEPCTLDPIRLEFCAGEPRWYSVKIAKIPSGVVWTVSDVSDREEMQREIRDQRDQLCKANERLTSLDKEKSEMLKIAAHDLRSPIGNIRSLTELIAAGEPDAPELLRTIMEVADSLLSLIGNLLDIESIERGQIDLDLKPVLIAPVATQLADRFRAEASLKGIEVHLQLPANQLSIQADESAMRRILQNLISNAVKFSPRGSPVAIRVREARDNVRIEIKDKGRGITELDRAKLFCKFARLSARPTAGEASTGLGLSIVKALAEAMNGEVGCDSEPGKGATFWVELPAAPPKAAEGSRDAKHAA
jgi:signal transduction histidine kinase/tetratricopeptide (TPR) repeat protein